MFPNQTKVTRSTYKTDRNGVEDEKQRAKYFDRQNRGGIVGTFQKKFESIWGQELF